MAKPAQPSILWLVSHGFDACLLWRTWWVVKALRAKGYKADWRYFERFNAELKPVLESGQYNIVVTPRYSLKEEWMTDRFASLLARNNIKWVYETDDDLFSREVLRRQTDFFFSIWPEAERAGVEWELEWERNERIRSLRLVDASIVTTRALKRVVEGHSQHRPVYVVPNGMDTDWFQHRMRRQRRWIRPLTVGWAGGWRGIEDIQDMAEGWAAVARTHPRVSFVVYGDPHMQKLFARYVPEDRLHVIEWSKLSQYPSTLRNIDIACCSVADTDWNACKTPIKWMEASVAGSACVVSDALYGETVVDGTTALVATTPSEWEAQISRLVVSESLRRSVNLYARQTIGWKHTIGYTVPRWIEVFSDILTGSPSYSWPPIQFSSQDRNLSLA